MRSRALILSLAVLSLFLSIGIPAVLAVSGIERASIASDGTQGNHDSAYNDWPRISGDGRYVAFSSNASNLVSGDTNGVADVFLRDRQSNTTSRVSVATDGTQANADCIYPSISADGRYIAFASIASSLVSGDTNGYTDIFVHDRQSGTTTRASVASDGTQANGSSIYPSISADGRYIAFASNATNLVSKDRNGYSDVFVRDLQSGTTTIVSVTSDGIQGSDNSSTQDWPSISADGRYVAFSSKAGNLVSGDTYAFSDVFVRDRQSNTTTRVSVASDGTQATGISGFPSISADGRYVAFWSRAKNLVSGDFNPENIFVRDLQANRTTRVSVASDGAEANNNSFHPSISADGRYVAFFSSATNLVNGDSNGCTDVFVHDRQTRTTSRISVAADGTDADSDNQYPSISANGRYVAFASLAGNLVKGDTSGLWDIFVAGPLYEYITSASVDTSLGKVKFNINAGSISGLANMYAAGVRCSAPSGYIFPYEVFAFNITGLTAGQQVSVTIKFPRPLPPGTKYYKCINDNMTDCTSLITRVDENTLILTLTDGGPGDADGTANGTIIDPGGPAFPLSTPQSSSAPAPATAPQALAPLANISVISASLSATKVTPGTRVIVTASVANTGTGNESSVIKVYINGAEEAQQDISVNSGGSARVSFDVSRKTQGTYTVYVGGTSAGNFTVDQFTPDYTLFIDGALVFFILVGGIIIMTRRRTVKPQNPRV